jgi:VanZ family protein
VLIALAILALTLLPTVMMPTPPWLRQVDKLYHTLAFAALVIPASIFDRGAVRWLVIGGLILGGAIEVTQPSVGRDADLMDFVADAAGLLLGLALGWYLRRTFGRQ